MESAFCLTFKTLRFRVPQIPHSVGVIILALTFHIEDPEGVGGAVNILLFLDFFQYKGLEAVLLARKLDAVLGGDTLALFSDTSLLMAKQKVSPVIDWDESTSQIEAWEVICTIGCN